jgi:hypothetical protein
LLVGFAARALEVAQAAIQVVEEAESCRRVAPQVVAQAGRAALQGLADLLDRGL